LLAHRARKTHVEDLKRAVLTGQKARLGAPRVGEKAARSEEQPARLPTLCVRRVRRRVKGFVQYFMNYGLIAAVLVWAAVVGLMAYHLEDSPWRWAFTVLAAGGLATVGGIIKIRKYVDGMNKESQQEHHS